MTDAENPQAAAARERYERGLYLNDVLARSEERIAAELRAATNPVVDPLTKAREALVLYATTTRTVTADGLAPLIKRLEIEAAADDRPSRFTATPVQIEAFLAKHIAEDVRLRHQQAMGGRAVSEAAKDVRMESHSPLASEKFTNGMLFAADHIDPLRGGGPYPSELTNLGGTTVN